MEKVENTKKTFEELKKEYLEEPRIPIMKYLTSELLEIFNKLEIKIEDKLYTEYEYDLVDESILEYYVDETDPKCEPQKKLSEKNVTSEQYQKLLYIFSQIVQDYNL